MGNVHAHRGQLASAFVFTILVAVALLAFGAMLFTDNANAQTTYTLARLATTTQARATPSTARRCTRARAARRAT